MRPAGQRPVRHHAAMSEPRPAIPKAITGAGVLAIARRLDPVSIPSVCDALLQGGIGAFELTLNEPESTALRALQAAVTHAEGSGMLVGAGTVLSIDAVQRAVDAGAAFLVSPHTDTEVIEWTAHHGIPMFPGAATPTEVLTAWRAGASAIKVFPASSLGTSFIRELRGPFPDIPLLPTGGISVDNVASFIHAGSIAVGIGSWLFAGGSAASITQRARQATGAVAEARRASEAGEARRAGEAVRP
jgi:2-dehydro-3-deoxyphosphogluconate aldolase/(4S)-4-hydroxy-2-oxoglutarate aldolase